MKNDPIENNKKYPQGHFLGLWTGLGVAFFAGIGVPISIALDNFAFVGIGPAIGIAIGISIGQALENKYEKEGKIRPLTASEKRRRKVLFWTLVGILLLGIAALLITIF